MRPLPSDDDIARIRTAALFDACWYVRHYPDVARLTLDPATHFARIGAFLGRDPGPNFSSRFYLASNPDVAAAGINPLLHYLSTGRAEGRLPHPGALRPLQTGPQARLSHLRHLLETGGLDDGPRMMLKELTGLQDTPDIAAGAAEALAFWSLQQGQAADAQRWFETRLQIEPGAEARLAPLQIIAAIRAGDVPGARNIAATAPDSIALHLARSWLGTTEEERLSCLNMALSRSGLSSVSCIDGPEAAFDRLTCPTPACPAGDRPLITVLMAVHNSEDTLNTAIRAIQAQSWPAFELVVIDDASTDGTAAIAGAAAEQDQRIRLITLDQNIGAYGARNAGLAEAKGQFITLHDADDWSHPDRLSRQVTFLLENPGYAGCLSQQARYTADLRVSRWTGTGALVFENLTSLMLPTDLIRGCLGGWDNLRVSSDSELLRRTRKLFGERAVVALETGPLALQRDSTGNATADSATGMGWFYYGARREYYEAQLHHHATASTLFYPPGAPRAFPAPEILKSRRTARREHRLDRVYAGILTVLDDSLEALLGWLEEDRIAGRCAGLVPLYATTMPAEGGLFIHPKLRALVDGHYVRILCYGEQARCDRYRRLPGQDVPEPHRYLPRVHEGGRIVLTPGQAPDAGQAHA